MWAAIKVPPPPPPATHVHAYSPCQAESVKPSAPESIRGRGATEEREKNELIFSTHNCKRRAHLLMYRFVRLNATHRLNSVSGPSFLQVRVHTANADCGGILRPRSPRALRGMNGSPLSMFGISRPNFLILSLSVPVRRALCFSTAEAISAASAAASVVAPSAAAAFTAPLAASACPLAAVVAAACRAPLLCVAPP